jgi:hypothetical protein
MSDSAHVSLDWTNTGLFKGLGITPIVARFTLASYPNYFYRGYTATAQVRTYVLAGSATGLNKGFKTIAQPGSYTLGTVQVNVLRGAKVTAPVVEFNVIGLQTGLNKGSVLRGAVRSFSASGTASGLYRGYLVVPVSAEYSLVGIVQYLIKTSILVPQVMAVGITAGEARFFKGKAPLIANTSEISIIGQGVVFRKHSILNTRGEYDRGVFLVRSGISVGRLGTVDPGAYREGLREDLDTWRTDPQADSLPKDTELPQVKEEVIELEMVEDVTRVPPKQVDAKLHEYTE